MKEIFSKKEYVLEIITPIYVGYGDVYTPFSFVFDPQINCILYLDMNKFIHVLPSEDKNRFSKICMQGDIKSLLYIYKFMSSQVKFVRANPELIIRKIPVCSGFREHFNKVISTAENNMREFNKFYIEMLSYNPNENKPIIPGSSIKGSIRTAILNKYRYKAKNKNIKNSNTLEKIILEYKTPKEDIMKRIKISDFLPKNKIKTKIVYGINRKKDGSRASGPYQIFEVIEPGSKFFGEITICKELDKKFKNSLPIQLSFKMIEEALKNFYGEIQHKEIETVNTLGGNFPYNTKGLPIKIGRHSGAEAVTIEGFRSIRIKQKRGYKTLDHSTTIWFAAQDKKNYSLSSLLPFGWARFVSEGAQTSKKKNSQKKSSLQGKKDSGKSHRAMDFSSLNKLGRVVKNK